MMVLSLTLVGVRNATKDVPFKAKQWSPQMDLCMGVFSLLDYKALTLKNCIRLVDLISGLVRKDLVGTT